MITYFNGSEIPFIHTYENISLDTEKKISLLSTTILCDVNRVNIIQEMAVPGNVEEILVNAKDLEVNVSEQSILLRNITHMINSFLGNGPSYSKQFIELMQNRSNDLMYLNLTRNAANNSYGGRLELGTGGKY